MTIRPDIETALIKVVNTRLGVRTSGKADRIGQAEEVVLRATGGEILDARRSVHQISVSAWGTTPQSDLSAYRLASKALNLIESLPIEGWVGKYPCHHCNVVVSPYPDPDPKTGISRYSFAVRLHMAGITV